MVSIRFQVEQRGVLLDTPRALEVYRREIVRGGVEATEMMLAKVVAATPVGETSLLRKGWQRRWLQMGVPFISQVFNPVPYGEIVEKGSRPHEIRPRTKKALAFIPGARPGTHTWAERIGGGETVFARRVHHPGTKGRRFVEKTRRSLAASSAWAGLWTRVVDRIVQALS